MASARIDTGVPIYDSTTHREVPRLTLHPQWHGLHEVPVYAEIVRDDGGRPIRGWAIHGPQEPLEIGVEAGGLMPFKGVNPVTGKPRLQFEVARPVPFVHSMIVEWHDPDRDTVFHWEGGVRIHQVARKAIWYQKSAYGDDGSVSANPDKAFAIVGKVIFVQRFIKDAAGEPAVAGSCASFLVPGQPRKLAGGPGSFKLDNRGTKLYPPFPGNKKTMMFVVGEAKFNPMRWPHLAPFLNRQGMVADAKGMHERMRDLTPDDYRLADDWDTWDLGDSLPHADVPASIQHH